jgi:hypothetical protein
MNRHFSKTDHKRWSFAEYNESDETIALASVSFEIAVADIYNKVRNPTLKSGGFQEVRLVPSGSRRKPRLYQRQD